MNPAILNNLEYVLIPGKLPFDSQDISLYEQCFDFWKAFWTKTLESVGVDPSHLVADDFMRHDFISAIRCEGQVVAMLSHSLFRLDTKVAPQHRYFQRYFQNQFFDQMASEGATKVMSMEYIAVHPDFRASRIGVSLGHLLTVLGMRIGKEAGIDALIAAARSDVVAAELCYKIGADPIVKGVMINGCPTDLVAVHMKRSIDPKDATTVWLLNRLWKHRIDLIESNSSYIRAA